MKPVIKFYLASLFMIGFALSIQGQGIGDQTEAGELQLLIRTKYVDSVNIDSIIDQMVSEYLNQPSTLKSLLQQLDPHSYYYSPEEYGYLKEGLQGSYSGIGIQFRMFDDTATVVQVFNGGPAEKAGLTNGSHILTVNGLSIAGRGLSVDSVFYLLRGPEGTSVDIGYIPDNNMPLHNITCVRAQVFQPSVEAAYMLSKQTGYIQLTRFTKSSPDEMHHAIGVLKQQGMKELILDLRNNSGGYLNGAVAIAGEFLPKGSLVTYTIGVHSGRSDYFTTTIPSFENGELIVLVNNVTVSSGEILTGALQDNHRATIVGTRTFGKGLVQVVFPLADSTSGVVLTTARYYTPSGVCIQRPYDKGSDIYYQDYTSAKLASGTVSDSYKENKWGIYPDVQVSDDTLRGTLIYKAIQERYYIEDVSFKFFVDNQAECRSYKDATDLYEQFIIDDELFSRLKNYILESEKALSDDTRINLSELDLNNIRNKLETAMKAYLAYELWGNEGYVRVMNINDADVQTAFGLLRE